MAPGSGTFLISWAQTDLDGLVGTDLADIAAGSTWRWHGRAIRVDDPRDILLLENGDGAADTHRRAADRLRRFLGDPGLFCGHGDARDPGRGLFRYGFEITDGLDTYQVSLVEIENGQRPMLLFVGALPPVNQDLWVVSVSAPQQSRQPAPATGGTICFAPSTKIRTPHGVRLVSELCEGDRICTKDSGDQTIRWIASRRITGGRLAAMPDLRPIRLAADVLGDGEPDQDLILSPDHRVLVRGAVAQALFGTDEVLVAARDLVNDHSIRIDHRCRGIDYVHLMLDAHQIVWANGVEVESFHPAAMNPDNISPAQRQRLWDRFPEARDDAFSYGQFARRTLSRPEAALLSYGVSYGH